MIVIANVFLMLTANVNISMLRSLKSHLFNSNLLQILNGYTNTSSFHFEVSRSHLLNCVACGFFEHAVLYSLGPGYLILLDAASSEK